MSNSSNTPNLNKLVTEYQKTSAPPGFADRISTHIRDDGKHQPWDFPKFAYATSFFAAVLVSIFIVQSVENQEPEAEIARQDKTVPQQILAPRKEQKSLQNKQPTLVAKTDEKTVTPSVVEPKIAQQQNTTVVANSVTKEEIDLFFNTSIAAENSNLAILTDISDWLIEQEEISSPDIADLPDLNEIESIFETT